ncbi:MAG: polysaccharide deacetylase family protein [Solirubrobacterales bacterium]|nr:polysaccharide deacetylase family protein [Solirubrobacterales bacterium]
MSAPPGIDAGIAERRRRRRDAERRRRIAVRRRNALAGFALIAFAAGLLTGAGGTSKRPGGARKSTAPAQLASSIEDVPIVEDYHRPTPILMYHAIGAAPPGATFPDLFVPEPEFKQQIDWLAEHGYHAVTLGQLFAAWDDGRPIARKPIVISFDDGLRSQYVGALPVLRARRWPGVLNLKLASLEQGELSDEMVREMIDAGWEVDSHTITHADVGRLDGSSCAARWPGRGGCSPNASTSRSTSSAIRAAITTPRRSRRSATPAIWVRPRPSPDWPRRTIPSSSIGFGSGPVSTGTA